MMRVIAGGWSGDRDQVPETTEVTILRGVGGVLSAEAAVPTKSVAR
jgi:hypothetical protein